MRTLKEKKRELKREKKNLRGIPMSLRDGC